MDAAVVGQLVSLNAPLHPGLVCRDALHGPLSDALSGFIKSSMATSSVLMATSLIDGLNLPGHDCCIRS